MKNTFKLFAIIAMVALIAFSMAACGEKDPGDDGVAKTLIINGITGETGTVMVGVAYQKANSKNDPQLVAVGQADYAASVTIPLVSTTTQVQFTGSGGFYIILVFEGPTAANDDDSTYYYGGDGGLAIPLTIPKGQGTTTIPFSFFYKDNS